jgi:hypothetical protein
LVILICRLPCMERYWPMVRRAATHVAFCLQRTTGGRSISRRIPACSGI